MVIIMHYIERELKESERESTWHNVKTEKLDLICFSFAFHSTT
jgi:hypothetical protein